MTSCLCAVAQDRFLIDPEKVPEVVYAAIMLYSFALRLASAAAQRALKRPLSTLPMRRCCRRAAPPPGRGETYAGIAALDEHVAKNARHDAKVARVLNAQLERIDLEREVERVRREVGYAPPAAPTYEHFPKSLAQPQPHDVYFRRGLYDGEDSDSA